MDTYVSYDCDLSSAKQSLEEKGIAVIPNVLSADRCEELRQRAWNDFNGFIGLSQEDTSTYKNVREMYVSNNIIHNYSIGHLQWLWDIRQDPNVVSIFSTIWDTPPEEMLTSFDCMSFIMPPEITGKDWDFNEMWIHTDQSSEKKGFHCIQGSINLYPVNEGDGTLTILEGSHKYHEQYFNDHNLVAEEDYFEIYDEHYDYFYAKGCRLSRVKLTQGSLTLWDSRTFHQGSGPLRERLQPNFRLVSYVCMMPRKLASEYTLELKRKAFEDLETTSHWPCQVGIFPKKPVLNVPKCPVNMDFVTRPTLNDLGMKLAGF